MRARGVWSRGFVEIFLMVDVEEAEELLADPRESSFSFFFSRVLYLGGFLGESLSLPFCDARLWGRTKMERVKCG